MRAYYHITPVENWPSIQEKGLLPRIGLRSADLGEQELAVFLFPTETDAEQALLNWMGEWFDDKEEETGIKVPLALLRVELPDAFPLRESVAGYEIFATVPIPGDYILFAKNYG